MSKRLNDLRAKQGEIADKMDALATKAESESRDLTAAEDEVYKGFIAELAVTKTAITRAEEVETIQAGLAKPLKDGKGSTEERGLATAAQLAAATGRTAEYPIVASARKSWRPDDYLRYVRNVTGFAFDKQKHFGSFGELLGAVARHYASKGTDTDNRLVRAPTGASAADPTGGGFLVQVDFANQVFQRANDIGHILQAVTLRFPISSGSNGIKVPGVDESSRVTGSRWGGVQSYWVGEGTTTTLTNKPKFRHVEFDLKKLLSFMYTTDEMLEDTNLLNAIAVQAFSEEVMFMTEDSIFRGTGAGQPLGLMNAPCKVAVAKEAGQATKTIVYENVLNMWSRCWARSRPNAVWWINQDIEPQLLALNQAIGTGGVPVYLPAGGIANAPNASLMGKPVIAVEYCDTLGNEGDIVLADFSQYGLAEKGGVQTAVSMDVAFLTDESVFRIRYRVDGKPMWHVPVTPFKGSATKSPFITLAVR